RPKRHRQTRIEAQGIRAVRDVSRSVFPVGELMKILLVSPRGFCAGVRRAIDIVDLALKKFTPPIYVRKEIVHNKLVVEDFKKRGVIFIDEVEEAPAGSCVIFSAHGIAPEVRRMAKDRKLLTIDATCPLVTKVHLEVHRFLREGYSLVLI